jgi:hypothetical protein
VGFPKLVSSHKTQIHVAAGTSTASKSCAPNYIFAIERDALKPADNSDDLYLDYVPGRVADGGLDCFLSTAAAVRRIFTNEQIGFYSHDHFTKL